MVTVSTGFKRKYKKQKTKQNRKNSTVENTDIFDALGIWWKQQECLRLKEKKQSLVTAVSLI